MNLPTMTEQLEAMLGSTCYLVTDLGIGGDGMGGRVQNWVVGTTPIPCHLAIERRTPEQVVADRLQGRTAYKLHLPALQAIDESHRVRYGSVDYEVISAPMPVSGEVIRQVIVARLG